MDFPFEFIIGPYLEKAGQQLNGVVVLEKTSMFDVALADISFDYSTRLISQIRKYFESIGYLDIKRIFAFSVLATNLKRKDTTMNTEVKLMLIKDQNDEYSVMYFTGCNIDER